MEKIWNIKTNSENTAATEIAAVLNEYGDALVIQTDQKLGYFVNSSLDKDLLVFTFGLKYKLKHGNYENQFDLSLFDDRVVKLCKIYYDKNSNKISLGMRTELEPYKGRETIISIMEDILTMRKTNNIISNILYLSTERGYKPKEDSNIQRNVDIKINELLGMDYLNKKDKK